MCEACQKKTSKEFDDYLGGLEEQEQPEACNLDDEDCENCGS
tara:strand:- start:302 stop:427 length:126 start_codon:yes stop_codon:yes gene_type:complete